MIEYAFLNGEIMPIENANLNITDLALLRGYGVFDFFKSIDGRPIFMEDHLDRFENSTWLLGLQIPFTREELRKKILELIRLNQHSLLGIKLVCTQAGRRPWSLSSPVATPYPRGERTSRPR